MNRSVACLVCLAAVVWGMSPACSAIFVENFNDGLASTRWSVVSQQESSGMSPPDGSVNFAFDYSALGISNPSHGDTIGARIRTNLTNQPGNEGESFSIFPKDQTVSGRFFVELDMLVFNEAVGGQTEYGMVGVFLDNANPISPYQFGSKGGPLAWQYSGDGFTPDDLWVFKDGSGASTGAMSLGTYDSIPAGTIPGFETGISSARGSAPAATAVTGSWVKVRIESDGTTIKWRLNGAVIDSYDNSSGHYTSGNILIGGVDPFNSVSSAATGVIVDNVVICVPEPPTVILALAAVAGLGSRRRLTGAQNEAPPAPRLSL